MNNQDYQLTNLGKGTYGAENIKTNQSMAFATEQQAKDFFQTPTIDYTKAISPTLNYQPALAKPNQAIPAEALTPAQPIIMPTAQPQPNLSEAVVASAQQTSKSLEQSISPETETKKQYDKLFGDINTLIPGLEGKGEAQIQAEEAVGLPGVKKQLSDLNAQLLQKIAETTKANAEYERLSQSLENQSIPMNLIIGQQAQVRKQQLAEQNSRSADINLLQARASGLQGQAQAAQEYINRAIDLKYQDRESTINLKMQQLKLLEGQLDKEEKIRATALEKQYQEQQTKIADEKARQKEAINFGLQNNVNTPFYTRAGVVYRTTDGKAYSTPEQFFADGGARDFSNAPVVNLQPKPVEVNPGNALVDPVTGKTIYQAPTAKQMSGGGTSSSSGGKTISATIQKTYNLPSNVSQDDYNQIRDTLLEVKNSGVAWNEAWGQIESWLASNGLNPNQYQDLIADMLYPGGFTAYKKLSQSQTTNTSKETTTSKGSSLPWDN